jgi:hypothetical protein
MIKSFSCINIFSKNTKEITAFYHEKLEIPILSTLVNNTDGVNLGFTPDAPTICGWDANRWGSHVQGTVSLVFICNSLDKTSEGFAQKGIAFPSTVKYDWGTHELRLKDPDDKEVVIAELL